MLVKENGLRNPKVENASARARAKENAAMPLPQERYPARYFLLRVSCRASSFPHRIKNMCGARSTFYKRFACASIGLLTLWSSAMLGCAGERESIVTPARSFGDGPTLPSKTELDLHACVGSRVSQWSDTHYAIVFDIDMGRNAEVRSVRMRDSMLPDHGIEACMRNALEGLRLPYATLSQAMESRGAIAPTSRAPVGNVMAAAFVFELVPALVVAAGVTIVVAVTIHVIEEITTAPGPALLSKEQCISLYVKCTESKANVPCADCLHYCRAQREWPDWRCPR